MKKLLTLAAAGLVCVAGYAQSQTLVAEDRSGWAISGCSEANEWGDGGFDEIKDGADNTYWHSAYSNLGSYENTCPHYFVIDRGAANASNPIDGFGYLPRQESTSGNGYVTAYRLYVLSDITNLNTVHNSDASVHVNNHASLTSFLEGKTPTKQGTFDIVYNDDSTFGLRQVAFDSSQSGRYVLFVIDNTSSAEGAGKHANCAEFYLYYTPPTTPTTCTLNFIQGGATVASTSSVYMPVGSYISCPAEIGSGAGTVTVGGTINITLNDNIAPFKLVSARYQNQWAKSTAAGMAATPNSGSYEDGSWYLEVPQANGTIKIFNIDNFRFHKGHTGSLGSTPIPLAASNDEAGTFTVTRDDSGGEKIRTSDNNTGFNIQGNTVSYWTGSDVGSLWFMVYNKAAYDKNKSSYSSLDSFGGNLGEVLDTPFGLAYVPAKNIYATIALTDIAAVPEEHADAFSTARDNLKAAIDKAAAARFGKAGVDISAIISELQSTTQSANTYTTDVVAWRILYNANTFAAMGIASTAAVNTWNNYKNALKTIGYTQDDVNAIKGAYATLVDGSANTPGGAHIKLASNQVPNDFMLMRLNNHAYQVGRFGSDVNGNKTTWTLKAAEGGFRLYNEYAGKYVGFPDADNTPITPIASESEAPIFVLDLFDGVTARYGVKCIREGLPEDRRYLHTNGNNNIIRYSKGDNSSWYLHASDEATANNEANIGANDDLADVRTQCRIIGDGVGEYTLTTPNDAYEAACAQYQALTAESSNADKHAAAAAIRAAYSDDVTCTLNAAPAGRYMKFRGASTTGTIKQYGELFYTTDHGDGTPGSTRMTVDERGAGHSDRAAILYFDGSHLLSYSTGYYLSTDANGYINFISSADMAESGKGNTPASVGIAPKTNTYQINYATDAARYGMKFSGAGSAHWFVDRTALDNNADLAMVTSDGDIHDWYVTQVNELPVAIHADGYGSFIAPVAVSFNAENPVYVGSVSGNVLTFEQLQGEVIAPNTPVIVKGTPSTTVNATIHYDYVASDAPATLAVDESTIRLEGKYIAENKAAETDLSTFAKTSENATLTDDSTVKLNKVDDGSVIPVNSLLLTLHNNSKLIDEGGETATVNLEGNNVTGISAIEFRNLDGTREIYDLQGRRVSKAANGVYIINGKKVLVK